VNVVVDTNVVFSALLKAGGHFPEVLLQSEHSESAGRPGSKGVPPFFLPGALLNLSCAVFDRLQVIAEGGAPSHADRCQPAGVSLSATACAAPH
jgi:hypothetical protein